MTWPITRAGVVIPTGFTARRRTSAHRWWPLVLSGFLALALIAADWLLPLPEGLRTFLLLPLTGLVCAAVLAWSGRSESLLSTEGVDARVQDDIILKGLLEQTDGVGLVTPLHRAD